MRLEQFKQEMAQKRALLEELEQDVQKNRELLKEREEAYKAAILADKDEEADRIFPELEKLKTAINRDELKLATRKGIYQEKEREWAGEAFRNVREVKAEYQAKADELTKKATPLIAQLKALQEEANALNAAYKQEEAAYLAFGDRYGYRSQDVEGVSPYSGLTFGVWMQTKPILPEPPVVAKEKKPLPENPTRKQLAEHHRIV